MGSCIVMVVDEIMTVAVVLDMSLTASISSLSLFNFLV